MSAARVRQRTDVSLSSTVRNIGQFDRAQLRKSPDNEKYIKRVQILNQTGLDGKVQKIHTEESDEEGKPGIRAYGLPKKRLQNNGAIERVHIGESHIDDSKNGRLVSI